MKGRRKRGGRKEEKSLEGRKDGGGEGREGGKGVRDREECVANSIQNCIKMQRQY